AWKSTISEPLAKGAALGLLSISVPMTDITRILSALEKGNPHAAGQLLPLVYDELRKLAVQRMAQEKAGQTLQATALVHEAYLRLTENDESIQWNGRGHFFAAAAEAMRRILIENARRRHRIKHGGALQRDALAASEIAAPEVPDAPDDLLDLDVALDKLAREDPQSAELVKLRYF